MRCLPAYLLDGAVPQHDLPDMHLLGEGEHRGRTAATQRDGEAPSRVVNRQLIVVVSKAGGGEGEGLGF